MNFESFLASLNDNTKSMLIILCLDFPLAYVGCWLCYPAFRCLDIFPQVALASGVAVLLAMGGIIFNLACRRALGLGYGDCDVFPSVLPFALATAACVLCKVSSPSAFFDVNCGCCLVLWGAVFLMGIKNRHNHQTDTDTNSRGAEQ